MTGVQKLFTAEAAETIDLSPELLGGLGALSGEELLGLNPARPSRPGLTSSRFTA